MKVFGVLIFYLIHCGQSELIALTTAPSTNHVTPFNVFLHSSNIKERSTVVLTYKNSSKTIEISGRQKFFSASLEFQGNRETLRDTNLQMIINRARKCITKSINIRRLMRRPFAFIQFDKPIYRPNDIVKFQILITDNAGRPYHLNNIEVLVTDARDLVVEKFEDLEDQMTGFYEDEFAIQGDVNNGEWKMRVKLNNDERKRLERTFKVGKYSLPLFDIKINAESKIHVENGEFEVEMSAEYAHGGFVNGTANIKIYNAENQEIFNFNAIGEKIKAKIHIERDLKLDFDDDFQLSVKLNLVVEFQDSKTNLKFQKSKIIEVFEEVNERIITQHLLPLTPGKTYFINAQIVDFDGNLVTQSNKSIELFQTIEKSRIFLTKERSKVDGKFNKNAQFAFQTLPNFKKFNVELKHKGMILSETVTPNLVISDALEVKIDAKRHKIDENVKVKVTSPFKLNQISCIVTGKHGISFSEAIHCDDEFECQLYIKASSLMIPQSTVSIYSIDKAERIFRGSEIVKFEVLGVENYLKIEPSRTIAKPGQQISFKISSNVQSTITLIAIDKRLQFLTDDKVKVDDFVSEILAKPSFTFQASDGYFDGVNLLTVDDLEQWHLCNEAELKVLKMRREIEDFKIKFNDNLKFETKNSSTILFPDDSSQQTTKIRKNFSDIWIFETFELQNDVEIKTFTLPDASTTWIINAYALDSEYGVAVADQMEIKVEKEFYIESFLPHSIKFGEILRVDVVSFNRLKSDDLKVELRISQSERFHIVQDESGCQKLLNFDAILTEIPHKSLSKSSFYVKPLRNEDFTLKIDAIATSSGGQIFTDAIEVKVEFEDETIHHRDSSISLFNFREKSSMNYSFVFSAESVARKQSIQMSIEVSGNVFPNGLTYKEHSSLLLAESGVQVISRFAKSFFIYKYLQAARKLSLRQRAGLKDKLRFHFKQMIEIYKNQDGGYSVFKVENGESSTWLTAYVAKVFGQAMQLNVIDSDSDLIIEALNYLKSNQNHDGSFSESKLIKIPSNPDETAKFRDFHLTSCVLNAFIVNRDFVDENYGEVIAKINRTMFDQVTSVDNYDAAYAAYLYASNFTPEYAINIMKTLEQEAHTDGVLKYWDLTNKTDISASTKVLIASYAIMTYIKINRTELAEPIVKWLMKEKDENGNFHGTFDTNVALEALTEVESYSGVDRANILVKIKPERSSNLIVVEMNTLLTPKLINLPKTVTSYSMEVEGEGFAMITTHYEYFMDVSKASGDFEIEANVKKVDDESSELSLCGSHVGRANGSDFMPMMDIEINEGFEYDTQSDPMRYNGNIKRVEMRREGRNVVLTFNQMSKEKTCVVLLVKKLTEFDDKKSIAKIFNYYQRDNFAVVYFTIRKIQCQ